MPNCSHKALTGKWFDCILNKERKEWSFAILVLNKTVSCNLPLMLPWTIAISRDMKHTWFESALANKKFPGSGIRTGDQRLFNFSFSETERRSNGVSPSTSDRTSATSVAQQQLNLEGLPVGWTMQVSEWWMPCYHYLGQILCYIISEKACRHTLARTPGNT